MARWGLIGAAVFATVGGVAILVFAVLWQLAAGNTLAPGLTSDGFLSIRPGMSEAEVREILGAPLERETRVVHPGDKEWEYASPGFAGTGFAASIGFREGRVSGAEIKYYDSGLYVCTEGLCPQFFGDAELLNKLPTRRSRK